MAAYTQAQLDELRANYARGVKSIQKGDERIDFRSLEEMKQVIQDVAQELSTTTVSRSLYPTFSRGT